MHVSICMYVCMQVGRYVCMRLCTYAVCIFACISAHMHTFIFAQNVDMIQRDRETDRRRNRGRPPDKQLNKEIREIDRQVGR